jgi:hypothetical protein
VVVSIITWSKLCGEAELGLELVEATALCVRLGACRENAPTAASTSEELKMPILPFELSCEASFCAVSVAVLDATSVAMPVPWVPTTLVPLAGAAEAP